MAIIDCPAAYEHIWPDEVVYRLLHGTKQQIDAYHRRCKEKREAQPRGGILFICLYVFVLIPLITLLMKSFLHGLLVLLLLSAIVLSGTAAASEAPEDPQLPGRWP